MQKRRAMACLLHETGIDQPEQRLAAAYPHQLSRRAATTVLLIALAGRQAEPLRSPMKPPARSMRRGGDYFATGSSAARVVWRCCSSPTICRWLQVCRHKIAGIRLARPSRRARRHRATVFVTATHAYTQLLLGQQLPTCAACRRGFDAADHWRHR
jgi:hypothetical protein